PTSTTRPTRILYGTEMSSLDAWNGLSSLINRGGKYAPVTNSWTATSSSNSPSGRYGHTTVWTGSEMIVWGGGSSDYFDTGAQYNPKADTWMVTRTTNAPSGRTNHTAVWNGGEM